MPTARSRALPAAAAGLLLLAALLAAVPAAADAGGNRAPAAPQAASLDSEAPPGAPPHWLPGEAWVMQHWLPYDETRLYRLLGVDRGNVWRHLRDDTRNLAGLARERGWRPRALARALVAPWRGRLREPHRLEVLERRALRTLTQGHLAQHIFFHSLHQDAVPDNAPAIFGVASRAEFASLRRAELSPLQICRLNGLPGSHARERAEAVLRATAARGVNGQAMPAAQGRRLLARQLRQLPRWIQQTRYNGPPPIVTPRASASTASSYSNNAVVSADGRRVAYEAYDARLATAKRRGEIGVVARSLAAGAPAVSAGPAGLTPRSTYNPALSADGRWVVFESADGNLNFAKRYGQIRVLARDLHTNQVRPVSHPPGLGASRSAYNPTVSGDGRLVAFEAYDRPDWAGGAGRLVVHDLRTGANRAITPPPGADGAPSEPRLSADGRRLASTVTLGGRSAVIVHDLRTGRAGRASAPGEEAWEPVLSRDGGVVAYTAAGGGEGSRIVVADLRRGRRTKIAPPAGAGPVLEPSLSHDGRRVAFAARVAADRRTQVFLHDLATRRTSLVSRASGREGAPALGGASHPAISGDGRRVAFTSDAWNLHEGKCNSARGVFVRDVARATTRLVSRGDGAHRLLGPTKGSSTGADAFATLLCA